MAFCARCGAQVTEGAAFCGSCGSPVAAGVGPTPPSVTPTAAGTAMASNVAGLLTYILGFITGIIFLVIEPYNNDRFVRFHAFQSIFFNVAVVAFVIVFSIIGSIVTAVTVGLAAIILLPLWLLIMLALFCYWIFLMYKAYNNEWYMIPFVGELALKQAG